MSSRQYGIAAGHVQRSATGQTDSPISRPESWRESTNSVAPSPVSPRRDAPHPLNQYMEGSTVSTSSLPPPDPSTQMLRDLDGLYSTRMMSPSPEPGPGRNFGGPAEAPPPPPHKTIAHRPVESQTSIAPLMGNMARMSPSPSPPRSQRRTSGPTQYLGGAGVAGAAASNPSFNGSLSRASYYHGDGYDDDFDPRDIADDGDDGFNEQPMRHPSGTAAAAATGGAGMFKGFGGRNVSGSYGAVRSSDPEKSEWLQQQSSGSKRLRWIVGSLVALVLIGAIVGGVVGGVLAKKHASGSGSASGGAQTSSGSSNGVWDINSSQIQGVLHNKNLSKVFPGMDYTPLNAQYPACLSNMPDQNNVTLDVAILSQLTPAIRLYGTDCNQTEMVLTAIDKLGMNDTMKVWLGVYLDGNSTTNARQLQQMYDILDTYPASHFAGVIVGNEVLFSAYMTAAQLGTELQNVRSNLTAKKIDLTVSTADVGVAWSENPTLATSSDIVMANVHPFFGGVTAEDGTNWAWSFWQNNDVPLTAKTGTINGASYPKQIISEIGWPSQGGHDCGGDEKANYGCLTSDDGAVANITNMNVFMDGWICDAMTNGTNYFWFEAFDEPWKHQFDTTYDKWEPYWGLFDSDRNLKKGVKIPDCGGKTVSTPFF